MSPLRITLLLLVVLALPAVAPVALAAEPTTVLLVRHAEKLADAGSDPALSEDGEARARQLAHVVSAAGVDAVIVTEYRRTRDTAAPLAERIGINPKKLPASAAPKIAERIRKKHAGDTVVVVGHSNTLPAIMRELGAENVELLTENDYDYLFVVTLWPELPPAVTRLRFGEPHSSVN